MHVSMYAVSERVLKCRFVRVHGCGVVVSVVTEDPWWYTILFYDRISDAAGRGVVQVGFFQVCYSH